MILQKENRTKKAIANGDSGLVSSIDILNPGRVEDIYVGVDIDHASIENLNVKLISPSGKELVLHDNAAPNSNSLQAKYNREVLESFIGESAGGEWRLNVISNDTENTSILNSWVIGMSCTDIEGETSNVYLKDNNINGLSSKQYCQIDGLVNGLSLDVYVEHPSIGDLTVNLICPSGKSVTVHDRKGGDRRNLRATFSKATLRNLLGEQSNGEWALVVQDHNPKDTGCLKSWRLNLNIRHNDDFTKIEGIGHDTQNLLYKAGVNTFSQLVSASKNELKGILESDGYVDLDPSTWGLQAHLAATGKWDELTDLQQRLQRGEVVNVVISPTITASTVKRVGETIRLGNGDTTITKSRVGETIRLGNGNATITKSRIGETIRLGDGETTVKSRIGETIRLGDGETTVKSRIGETIRLGNNITERRVDNSTTTRLGNNITTRRLGGDSIIKSRIVRT